MNNSIFCIHILLWNSLHNTKYTKLNKWDFQIFLKYILSDMHQTLNSQDSVWVQDWRCSVQRLQDFLDWIIIIIFLFRFTWDWSFWSTCSITFVEKIGVNNNQRSERKTHQWTARDTFWIFRQWATWQPLPLPRWICRSCTLISSRRNVDVLVGHGHGGMMVDVHLQIVQHIWTQHDKNLEPFEHETWFSTFFNDGLKGTT